MIVINKEEIIKKPFYLIAKYWLGKLQGFIKIGDNKEEIIKLYEEKYKSIPEHDWGVTEESYQLLELNAKEILGDKE